MSVVLAVVMSASLPGQARADSAPGWFAGHSSTEQQAIVDWAYRGGPQGVTPYAGAAQTLGSSLYATEASTPTTAVQADELTSELLSLRQRARLLPTLAEAVPDIELVALTFELGWRIGTNLNAKFLHIGIPSRTDGATYCVTSPCPEHLQLVAASQSSPLCPWWSSNDTTHCVTAPVYQWTVTIFNPYGSNTLNTRQVPDGSGPDCDGDPPIPAVMHVMNGTSTIRCFNPSSEQFGYLTPAELYQHGPIKDFDPSTDQPTITSPAPSLPPQATVEQSIIDKLEADGSELSRAWLDWALDPNRDPAANPVATEGGDDQCRLAPKTDPDASPDGDAYHRVSPFRATPPSWPDDQNTSANLYWGTLAWGYRHIATEHGWGPEDSIDTQGALDALSPSTDNPHRRSDGSYIYYSYLPASANPNNVECTRVVFVRYGIDTGAATAQPKHILNSFGYLGHFRKYG